MYIKKKKKNGNKPPVLARNREYVQVHRRCKGSIKKERNLPRKKWKYIYIYILYVCMNLCIRTCMYLYICIYIKNIYIYIL